MKKILLILLISLLSCKTSQQTPKIVEIYNSNGFKQNCVRNINNYKKKGKKNVLLLKIDTMTVVAEEFILPQPKIDAVIGNERKKIKGIKAPRYFMIEKNGSWGVLTITDSTILGWIDNLNITNNGIAPSSQREQKIHTNDSISY